MTEDLTAGMSAVVFDFYGTLTPVSPPQSWAANAARLAAVLRVPVDTLGRALDETYSDRITGRSATSGRPWMPWPPVSACG
jgi:FMN phosphatase YigB (HAD superfamily)